MSKLAWYWRRLRAMSPGEMAWRAAQKLRQAEDARRTSWPKVDLRCSGLYPKLPDPTAAPVVVRESLQRDAADILAGRWRFFGHLPLQVDDPPRWQFDHLVRRDVTTSASAFRLDHRSLAEGIDSKLIWEPSRWHVLVRLAMAAHVLGDERAALKCVEWLEDWVRCNPPYRGWNWTSALEAGIRLIQFTWIDALLSRAGARAAETAAWFDANSGAGQADQVTVLTRLGKLRGAILPPHVWYVWRHRSFGSSANNHLLGEVAGLCAATARWPGLTALSASSATLAGLLRTEVMAQFAEDGGNREQALNYQLFSWELCWQARQALAATGALVKDVEERLTLAARYFWEVQARTDRWDYGDSDNAFVVPMFKHWEECAAEWHRWIGNEPGSAALDYWAGDPPRQMPPIRRGAPVGSKERGGWWYYPQSGMAIAESGYWWLRWDLSPLGYLSTAAHGHADALHLSIWRKGVALVIDPGTGGYFVDEALRSWLASWEAHNGPCLKGDSGEAIPRRVGPFLWTAHHEQPQFDLKGGLPLATLRLGSTILRRSVRHLSAVDSWEVADSVELPPGRSGVFQVRWQLAPGSWIKRSAERRFSVHRSDVAIGIEIDDGWSGVELVEPIAGRDTEVAWGGETESLESREGLVSSSFRHLERAPFLRLTGRASGDKPCVLTTTFLASAHR